MIGYRVKQLRAALNITQQEFADRIQIKRNTVAQYEIGRNEPIEAVISLICREFNVNDHWLRTGEGEMFCKMSGDEQLALLFGGLLHEDDSNKTTKLKKALIAEMLKLDDSAWQYVLSFIEKISQSVEKTEEQG